jgi:ceramide glucosyltransferase
MASVLWYLRPRHVQKNARGSYQPPVTLFKPVCGLEKDLKARLRTACQQDYPVYQVIFCVQSADDPTIPMLHEIRQEFGNERVTVVVRDIVVGPNGKVNNLVGGLSEARHDVLVISDSDVVLRPDYLTAIVQPLANPEVGAVNTLFKTTRADRWYEGMEQLTINADFIPSVVFTDITGAAGFCLGPSTAIRRSTLEKIGGLASLSHYLAEDYELGRRIWTSGLKMKLVPYVADVVIDLQRWSQWWSHQVYWDQNTRVANPIGFSLTILTKSVPFALLLVLFRLGDPLSLAILGATVAVRLISIGVMLEYGLRDREALRYLPLLPFRDVVALITWILAFGQRTVVWRGVKFSLRSDGRMVSTASQS